MRTTVLTPDGTALAARIDGPPRPSATATVVFVHGFCLNSTSWEPQRRLLRAEHPGLRMVTYDHRGHGTSAAAPPHTYTLDQLADDLDTILAATAATGPLILVGHSMGGMTILTHLRRHPATAHRLIGVALISTAAHRLTRHGVGRLLALPGLTLLPLAARLAPGSTQRTWNLLRRATAPLVGASGTTLGSTPVTAAAAHRHGCAMITATPAATIAAFLLSLRQLDEAHALSLLRDVPALVMCGTADVITPPCHAQQLAAALPRSELVLIDHAHHLLGLQHPRRVSQALTSLLQRSTAASHTHGLPALA